MRLPVPTCVRLLVLVCAPITCHALMGQTSFDQTSGNQPVVTTDLPSISSLRAEALEALQHDDPMGARSAADAIVQQYPQAARAARIAGDLYLRSGDSMAAAKEFDRYVEMEPSAMPELWQRGIALCLAGEYRSAAKQFEAHRDVNPNDVENAAWHFLCISKARSPEKAKQMTLPAPNDPRVPMQQVLKMLNNGDTDAVLTAVNTIPPDAPERSEAEFYGDLYLGLYADALGDRWKARELISRAAKNAPKHYMGDVAKVYAEQLKR